MVKWALIALMIYNLIDLVVTLVLLDLREILEINPFMAAAHRGSPLIFLLVKLSLVSLGGLLIYRLRDHPKVRPGFLRALLFLATFIYVVNVSYQMIFLVLVAMR